LLYVRLLDIESSRSDASESLDISIGSMHEEGSLTVDVRLALLRIVSDSSKSQALKGIISAGITKSVAYGLAKLKKGQKKP